jgi:hypothetical protein
VSVVGSAKHGIPVEQNMFSFATSNPIALSLTIRPLNGLSLQLRACRVACRLSMHSFRYDETQQRLLFSRLIKRSLNVTLRFGVLRRHSGIRCCSHGTSSHNPSLFSRAAVKPPFHQRLGLRPLHLHRCERHFMEWFSRPAPVRTRRNLDSFRSHIPKVTGVALVHRFPMAMRISL